MLKLKELAANFLVKILGVVLYLSTNLDLQFSYLKNLPTN